jgi:Spy/CpxP family protein refolding chaperone
MRSAIAVLVFGVAAGLGSHFGWLALQDRSGGDDLDSQLAWIKDDLQLTAEQYTQIRAIHERSSPRLLALASQVSRMRAEFAAFEKQRTTTGEIDFLEFAQFVEQRRRIDRECLISTRQLVDASAGVMTPSQRERYLSLLPAAHRPGATSSPN